MTGDGRKLIMNSYIYTSICKYINKAKEDEIGMACSMDGERRNAYGILIGKPEGKRPLGRPRRR
jgi:hypothetical protein